MTHPEPGSRDWHRTQPPSVYTRGQAVYQRMSVWTDDQGVTHGLIHLGDMEITFHDPAQVRDLIAHLAILAHEMDEEAARQEEDGEDPDDDGDTLNDQTAPYWPALGLGGAR